MIGLLLCMMIRDLRKNHIVRMWVGVVALALWAAAHLQSWWIPYLLGSSPERIANFYLRNFRNTWNILPIFGNHYPPNGGHTVLDIFVFAAFLLSLRAAVLAVRHRRKSEVKRADEVA